ncbi:MAG: hypothetical protein ACE5GQ_07110 [Nitrospinales bacterium]
MTRKYSGVFAAIALLAVFFIHLNASASEKLFSLEAGDSLKLTPNGDSKTDGKSALGVEPNPEDYNAQSGPTRCERSCRTRHSKQLDKCNRISLRTILWENCVRDANYFGKMCQVRCDG